MPNPTRLLALTLASTALAWTITGLRAADRTVWDGVYTEAQAARGKAAYEKGCQSCHAAAGGGGFGITYSGTALKGQRFVQTWEGDLAGLAAYAMSPPPGSTLSQKEQRHGDSDEPRGAKDPLTPADYVDVIAYLFQLNGFPAGQTELAAGDMRTVTLREKEPQPLPNFSLARSVGCLTQQPDKSWALTNATPPRRSRDGEPSKPSELKGLTGQPPGTATIALMDIYPDPDTVITPEEHAGHRVQAKGIYMKDDKGVRININVLEMVDTTCR
ncbi:MAG: c-type cytochrome [Vicinamibacterales bacterium]